MREGTGKVKLNLITYDVRGQMEPTLPWPVARALSRLRAMTTPYFDAATADEAERALRVAITRALAKAREENRR